MRKFRNKMVGKFRSKFEQKADEILKLSGLRYTYEEVKITLQDSFAFENLSYQRWGKKFKNVKTTRAMTYTPDFIVEDKYIIEIKGFRTPAFNLKWKLFKKHIVNNKLDWHIFMVHSQRELKEAIEIIKEKLREDATKLKSLPKRISKAS